METGLRDRVAIVSGSSQGIGRAAAAGLAAEGAKIALCARNGAALELAAQKLRNSFDVEVYAAPLDVTDDRGVRSFVAEVAARFGRVDICIANAGGPPAKPFSETTMAEWDRAFQLNLRSAVSFAHAALPLMQQRKWGRFITLTSVAVRQPVPSLVLSNAIRTGVLGLVRSLATQYGPDGITVNNVGPGFTATDRLKELAGHRAGATPEQQQAYFAELAKDVPLGRVAEPEEVADAIVWLASERASYVTGQTVLVDGGLYKGI